MAFGPGTYGSQVGRPSKKEKSARRAKVRAKGMRGSPVSPAKKFRPAQRGAF